MHWSCTQPSLQVFIYNFFRDRLHLHLDRAFIQEGEKHLCVANQEIEFRGRQLLHKDGTDDQNIGTAFQHNFIGKAAMEGAINELANEDILHCAFGSSTLTIQITYIAGRETQNTMRGKASVVARAGLGLRRTRFKSQLSHEAPDTHALISPTGLL